MRKVLILACLVFFSIFNVSSFAKNKVVVIPLLEESNFSEPIRIKKVINTYNITVPAEVWYTQYAHCPEGYIAIGGGYDVGVWANRKMNAIYSYPATTGTNSIWVVAVYNRTTQPVTTDFKVYAICLYGDYE